MDSKDIEGKGFNFNTDDVLYRMKSAYFRENLSLNELPSICNVLCISSKDEDLTSLKAVLLDILYKYNVDYIIQSVSPSIWCSSKLLTKRGKKKLYSVDKNCISLIE